VRSALATELVAALRAAELDLIHLLDGVDPAEWGRVPAPATWSIGKDSAHVAEAAMYHQWIVRRTIGERVPAPRPPIERLQLTTARTKGEAIDLIRRRTNEGATLIAGLRDEQLALPTQPPRARNQVLAETIRGVLIGHYDAHRRDIERKLRAGC